MTKNAIVRLHYPFAHTFPPLSLPFLCRCVCWVVCSVQWRSPPPSAMRRRPRAAIESSSRALCTQITMADEKLIADTFKKAAALSAAGQHAEARQLRDFGNVGGEAHDGLG